MEDDLRWKMTFDTTFNGTHPSSFYGRLYLMDNNPQWKTFFDRRLPSMDDKLRWKTTFNGGQPSMEDNLPWKTTNYWDPLKQIPTVTMTFVQATFVHISKLIFVSKSCLDQHFFHPNFLCLKIFNTRFLRTQNLWTQIFFTNNFWTKSLIDQKFYGAEILFGPNNFC